MHLFSFFLLWLCLLLGALGRGAKYSVQIMALMVPEILWVLRKEKGRKEEKKREERKKERNMKKDVEAKP